MIIITQKAGEIVGTKQNLVIDAIVDAPANLPAQNALDPYIIVCPSTIRCVSGERYMMDSGGNWIQQPEPTTVVLSLADYYTVSQTDAAISAALVGGGTFYSRGEVLSASADNLIDFHSIYFQKAGAWSFGGSNRPYIANLPASFPNTGATIRSMFAQREDRFFYLLTPNSPSQKCFWYAQYTGAWQNWHKVQGTEDV